MKMMTYIFLGLLMTITGCQKSDIEPSGPKPPIDTTSEVKVLWQSSVVDTTRTGQLSGHNIKPILYKNLIISSYYQRLSDDTETLFAFDKLTGDTVWIWDDFSYSAFGERSLSIVDRPVCENLMYYSTEEGNYVIDLNNGTTVRKERAQGGNPEFVDRTREGYLGCSVFQPRQFGTPAGDSVYLYQKDMDSGNSRVLYKTYEVRGLYPTVETPLAWEMNGEKFVAFYTSFIPYNGPAHGRLDSISLVCFNLSQNKEIWTLEDYDPEGWGNVQGCKLEDGLLYMAGRVTIHCIDPLTGDIVWQHRDESFGSLHTADLVFDERAVFFKSGSGFVASLDKKTGNILWEERSTDITGASSMRMFYYDGKLIYSDNRLIVLDANTGENLVKTRSPNESVEFPSTTFSHITVDEESNLFYAGDGYYIMCFQLDIE